MLKLRIFGGAGIIHENLFSIFFYNNIFSCRCIRDFEGTGSGDTAAAIIASGLHPRFAELHGRSSAHLVALIQTKTSHTLKSDLIEVIIKNLTFISNGTVQYVV